MAAGVCIVGLLAVPPLYLIEPLLATAFAAMSGLSAAVWYGIARSRSIDFLYVWSFAAGNLASLVVAHLGYFYLTDLPRGRHHELTIALTGALVWSVLLGAVAADVVLGRTVGSAVHTKPRRMRLTSQQGVWTLGIAFALLATAQVATGTLNARFDLARESTGWAYVVAGVSHAPFLFFFVLGAGVRRPLVHWSNFARMGVLLFWVLAQGLTGGREPSLWMLLLFLVAAASAGLSGARATLLAGGAALLAFIFIYVIGIARGVERFGEGNVEDRIDVMVDVTRGNTRPTGEADGWLDVVLSRAFETPAQLVIDQVEATGSRAGFDHFERLAYTFVPKAFAPDKVGADDGTEVLVQEYGLRLVGKTAVALPLVADAYRRGGLPWVVAVGFLAGVWLRFVATLTRWIVRPDALLAVTTLQALFLLRAYTCAVPGFIVVASYIMARDFMLLFALTGLVDIVILITEVRQPRR
jgi:hypothetical protein